MKLLAVVFVVAYTVTLTGLGWWLVGLMDRRRAFDAVERAALGFGLGGLILHYGIMAIGPIRLDAASMGALGIGISILAVPGLRSIPWPRIAASLRGAVAGASRQPFLAALWILMLAVAASSILQGLAPPNDYDSLMYHLALPQYDIELGRADINWRAQVYPFYPALLENQARFGLALVGEPAVQMQSGVFGLMAAALTAALVRRLGFGSAVQVLAAFMFLAIRAVIWEMASLEVDHGVAAYTAGAVVAYLAWRERGGFGTAILFGLAIGGALNVKYHGFPVALAFAPVMLWDLAARRRPIGELAAGPVAALVSFAPHMARNFYHTNNPVFPLFNGVFNPDGGQFLLDVASQYGTGRDVLSLVAAPWNIFVVPMHYFDGMIFGAPYLLALAPLILLARPLPSGVGAMGAVAAVYFVEWFYLVSQQVRFLLPIFPILAAFAAAGAAVCWRRIGDATVVRGAFVAVCAVLAFTQALFVGIYAVIRLPPAVGLMSPSAYHSRTPTLGGAFYETCMHVRRNLKPDERYLSLLPSHFYYCPQVAAISSDAFDDEVRLPFAGKPFPALSAEEFIRRIDAANVRFVIVQTRFENRRNPTGEPIMHPIDLSKSRWGRFIAPVLGELKPLAQDRFSAVYDGRSTIDALRQFHERRRTE